MFDDSAPSLVVNHTVLDRAARDVAADTSLEGISFDLAVEHLRSRYTAATPDALIVSQDDARVALRRALGHQQPPTSGERESARTLHDDLTNASFWLQRMISAAEEDALVGTIAVLRLIARGERRQAPPDPPGTARRK